MESKKVKDFLTVSPGAHRHFGYECGSYSSTGSSDGHGSSWGAGDGCGSGSSPGYSYGPGSGSGCGLHYTGEGHADGSGYGYSYDSNYGPKSINKKTVYYIDGVPTIITAVFGNLAKGKIINNDLTMQDCFVVKSEGVFAHGATVKEAREALLEKLFEKLPKDERIDAFIAEHPDENEVLKVKDLYEWHHRLTGSCEMGRKAFAVNHGIDVENDSMTVKKFIEITENSYGGDIIKELKDELRKRKCDSDEV